MTVTKWGMKWGGVGVRAGERMMGRNLAWKIMEKGDEGLDKMNRPPEKQELFAL